MSSHIIYEFALPKAKNIHYLKRYLKFIEQCKIANVNNPPDYIENHHILPKAKDLFPEFADNKQKYKWNSVNLSFRQHLIAHIMLWKIFGWSQIRALQMMMSCSKNENWLKNRKIPPSIELRYLEKVQLAYVEYAKNKSYYYDENKQMYFLDNNDSLITELNLKGNTAGSKWYNNGIENFRINKGEEPNPIWIEGRLIAFSDEVLKMYSEKALGAIMYNDGIHNFYVSIGNEPESHWVKGMIIQNEEKHEASLAKRSKRFANSKWYNNGVRNFNVADGELPNPDWIEGKLCNFTEEGLEKLSKKAKNSRHYNDGIRNFKVDAGVEPDPSWVKGMIIDPEVQAGIAEFNRKKFTGSQFWNDGVKNHLVFIGQEPEPGWVRGMLVDDAMIKRNRESTKKLIDGCTVYNDGVQSYKLKAGCEPEAHWVKGYVPRPNRRIYNNGVDQRMFDNDPGGEWVLGVIKGNVGRPWRRMYNNGKIQKMFDDDPGGEWELGKLDKSGMKAYKITFLYKFI